MKSPKLFSQLNPNTNGYPEIPAQFPNGTQAMYRFIRQSLEYPMLALEEGLEGTVVVGFTITEKGDITNPTIIHSLDVDCDDAALQLLRQMPKWVPAQNLNKPVSVQVQLPIQFTLALVPSEYE